MLVSKAWYRLAKPHLYHSVRLWSLESGQLLLDTIYKSDQQHETIFHLRTSFIDKTKRLLSGAARRTTSPRHPMSLLVLKKLLACTPSLKTLDIGLGLAKEETNTPCITLPLCKLIGISP